MIRFESVSKSFNGNLAVDGLDLTIEAGEFVVLLGTSGSGKTTTLKMINRLVERDQGQLLFDGRDVRNFSPEILRRHMGYAIQSGGLFPHWTVERNIATVPTLLGWSKGRIQDRVSELLNLLHLPAEQYRQRYPHELSGGQMQRVGVARALAADPDVLLMDEPFGALDPVTRLSLQDELARIHRLSGKTIVLVSHDIDEALRLASRIVLLDSGRIVQQGTPAELLAHPANDFVIDFIGRSELGIRLLGLGRVEQHARTGESALGEPIPLGATLREALSAFVTRRVDRLPVADADGRPAGVLHFADLLGARA